MSNSAGEFGTLAMVSLRPSVEPMPMDANDRTDTASDQDRRSDDASCGGCCRCCFWFAAVNRPPPPVEFRLEEPAIVVADPGGEPGGTIFCNDSRLGDSALVDMGVTGGWRHDAFRNTGCRRPRPLPRLLPSLLSLLPLLATTDTFVRRADGTSVAGRPVSTVKSVTINVYESPRKNIINYSGYYYSMNSFILWYIHKQS